MAKQTRTKTVKKIGTSPYNYTPSKGIHVPGESETIQDDSISLREMVEKHVQGVLEPGDYKQGQYDGEESEVNFDTDTGWRENKTELEALEYAEEHGMTIEEINEEIDAIKSIQNLDFEEPEIEESQPSENEEKTD